MVCPEIAPESDNIEYDPRISLLNAKVLLIEKVFHCRGVLRLYEVIVWPTASPS